MEVTESMIRFVREHEGCDVNALRLKYAEKSGNENDFPIDFALMQIEARRKTRKKLSDFIKLDGFIFPSLIAAEQSTNQSVARFHASALSVCSSVLDLTAGLGIDDISFALNGINVTSCEIDDIKCQALRHNAAVMGVEDRINVKNTDSIEFLRDYEGRFDAVFADPARRDTSGGKVHALAACQPDILQALPDILNITDRLVVKCSPLLDLTFIRETVSDLHHIYVVCFKGECKEVLIDIRKEATFSGVSVVDMDSERVISSFHTDFSPLLDRDAMKYAHRISAENYAYLYEPNAGVMKTGDWQSLQSVFPDLEKADANTHLFLSDTLYPSFPGRVSRIEGTLDRKEMKRLKGERLNVVSRNHPITAPLIYKKYGIQPGADCFLYAFRYIGNPIFVQARVRIMESESIVADSVRAR